MSKLDQTYSFALSRPTTDEEHAVIATIPGTVDVRRGRSPHVLAPLNAGWLVASIAQKLTLGVMRVEGPEPIAEVPWVALREHLSERGEVAAQVDGVDFLYTWLKAFQGQAVAFICARGAGTIWASGGCLAGNTDVCINRAGKAWHVPLRELVHKFNGGDFPVGRSYGHMMTWDAKIPTRVQGVDLEGYGRLRTLVRAFSTGEKPVYKVTTRHGKQIEATKDHLFYGENGWIRLEHVRPGDVLYVLGEPKKRPEWEESAKPRYLKRTRGAKNHPYAHSQGVEGGTACWTHRLIVEANASGLSLEDFQTRLDAGNVEGLTFLDPAVWHVHHKDRDTFNNALSNLAVERAVDHFRLHGLKDSWRNVAWRAMPDIVESISGPRVTETFDLELAEAPHAYAASGFITHNSGKTAIAVVAALCAPPLAPVLCVTRGGARDQWAEEATRYSTLDVWRWKPAGAMRRKDRTLAQYLSDCATARRRPFVVAGWEQLVDIHEAIELLLRPGVVIWDEVHLGKAFRRATWVSDEHGKLQKRDVTNQSSIAAKIAGLPSVQWRIATTATPIYHRAYDLWGQLTLVEPWAWSETINRFRFRHCDPVEGEHGWRFEGRTNVEELRKRLSFSTLQIPYQTSHGELPPKRRRISTVPVEAQKAPGDGSTTEIKKLLRGLAKAEKAAQPELIRELREKVTELRIQSACLAKRAVVVEHVIAECKRHGEPVEPESPVIRKGKCIVMVGRRAHCEIFRALLETAGAKLGEGAPWLFVAHGEIPPEERNEIRKLYMAASGPCVLIATYQSFGACVPPETWILGANKPIGDFVAGDQAYSQTGAAPIVAQVARAYSGFMVEIHGTGILPVRATSEHPILVAEGHYERHGHAWRAHVGAPAWKRAADVKPWIPQPKRPQASSGDFAVIPRLPGKFATTSFDLEPFIKDERSKLGRRTRGLPTSFLLNVETAWCMGLYVAEGSANAGHGNGAPESWKASFALGEHEETTLGARLISTMNGLGFKTTVRRNPEMHGFVVVVGSTPVALLFQSLFGKGAHNKCIPPEIMLHQDLAIVRAFLGGYAAGDGHSRGWTTQAATVSLTLALQLQLALARLGRLACVIPWRSSGKSTIRGRPIKASDYYVITWRWENGRHQRYKVTDGYLAIPIKSTTTSHYEGPVVDIETIDHTFLASNIVVHNSLNLHDTDYLALAQLPVTPGELDQIEARVHRLGMERETLIEYFVAERTIDQRLKTILLDKLPSVEAIMGSETAASGLVDTLKDVAGRPERMRAMLTAFVDDDYELED